MAPEIFSPDLVLPTAVKSIEKEAFMGSGVMAVKVPYGALLIEERAFANCTSLRQIEIPETVEKIADTAFQGCEDVMVFCASGSYAENYARDHEMKYSTD